MINAGMLTHRIKILKIDGTTEDICGAAIPLYKTFCDLWAFVKPLRGREYEEAKKIRAEQTYKIVFRYIKGLDTDMKIKFKNKLFEIIDIINVDERNKEINLMCIEKVK